MRTLRDEIADLIALEGPIGVERYMALCLGHPTLGYYATRDPFGAAGDFVTAPEISQIFGELIGLWIAQCWLDLGQPSSVSLVEIGPGRGTLMADALRAIAKALPACLEAATLTLVETSPVLRARQAVTLATAPLAPRWREDVGEALNGPLILIANELLDALPVHQFVAMDNGWHERLVGLDESGGFRFGLAREATPSIAPPAPPGTVLELPLAGDRLVGRIAAHLSRHPGAALFIDYGAAEPGFGDTLQAVRRHRFVDPLAEPGEADLTTQVQFARVAEMARMASARCHGPIPQAAFLDALGLERRAAALAKNASPAQVAALQSAIGRLTAMEERGMGALFKAIGLSHPALTALPGFPPD